MNRFLIGFVKATGYPFQRLFCRTKFFYEDRALQGRRIKDAAIVVTNHTAIFDFIEMMMTFPSRILRYQMAEVLFRKKSLLPWFLRQMGGIFVDREGYDFSFLNESMDILARGGVVGIFPEARLPKAGEARPLAFKTSAAYLALKSGVKVIPVYTEGLYGKKKPNRVMIGKPIYACDVCRSDLSEKENIALLNETMRGRVIELEQRLKQNG